MSIEVRPATEFDDVATIVGPKKPTSNVCFCLTYRLDSKEHNALHGPARADRMRELCHQDPPPGVIAYLDDEPGVMHDLVDGAVAYAKKRGAPAVEAYPVDNRGEKVDMTMMYVGTKSLFEKAGFTQASETDSVLNGFSRVLMRLDLR